MPGQSVTGSFLFSFPPQVQDIEFTQIEMKVIEGLKIGNECLNKMHQVLVVGSSGGPACSCLPAGPPTAAFWLCPPGYVHRGGGKDNRRNPGCCGVPEGEYMGSWELCSAQSRGGFCIQQPPGWGFNVLPSLPQQIDELLAGSLTEEDEDAILEELNAITQVGLMFLWLKSTFLGSCF